MTTLQTPPTTRPLRAGLSPCAGERPTAAPAAMSRRGWLASIWITAGPGAPIHASATARLAVILYALAGYAIFLATFLYAAGFVGGFLAPTSLDAPRRGPLAPAIAVNLALLLLFAVQHSVMARPWFKAWWTRYVPDAAERSTYVLFSSLALIALFALWQPIGGVVWDAHHPLVRAAVWTLFAAGWALVFVSTCLINHFDLFGLRQAWHFFRGRDAAPLAFTTPGPYRLVRHPLYVGWLLGFWATPTMTASHLLFALVTTAYILAAIRWEERDLVAAHPEYEAYRARTGMLTPRLRRA